MRVMVCDMAPSRQPHLSKSALSVSMITCAFASPVVDASAMLVMITSNNGKTTSKQSRRKYQRLHFPDSCADTLQCLCKLPRAET